MLRQLTLRDFLFIERAEIAFGAGFCVLTGETGAGKSILLDALGLGLGGRADSTCVRPDADRAEIVAEFDRPAALREWLGEAGLDADEPAVLLRRVIDRDGRSRAYINGTPVTAGQLRACGEQLLEIHGQHASQALLNADGQRRLLDAFGRLESQAAGLEQLWRRWREAQAALAAASAGEREREQALAAIEWQLEGIDALAPGDDEWQALNGEQTRLAHGQRLIETAGSIAEALTGHEDTIRDRLESFISELRACERLDARLGESIEMLEAARINIDETASNLAHYVAAGDLDPERLAVVEARVGDWFAIARKLRIDPGELATHARSLREQAARLEQEGNLATLQAACDSAENAWRRAARALSAERARHAAALSERVSRSLPELGMAQASFTVTLEPSEPGPSGLERIGFAFSGHPDLPQRPLARVASGGELSRISLAITVAAADANPVPTLIFDEADAGIGGSVGDAIGRLMRRLGADRQILAVTHLPQVAACAHWHLRVLREQRAVRRLDPLDADARIDEVARMLGGGEASRTSRDHARELIELAQTQPAETPAATSATAASTVITSGFSATGTDDSPAVGETSPGAREPAPASTPAPKAGKRSGKSPAPKSGDTARVKRVRQARSKAG
ncbi:MAG: DNA repair protein RecN [Burkholderiaceae bacterium]